MTMLWSLLRDDPVTVVETWVDGQLQTMTVDGFQHLRTGDGLPALAARLETFAEAVDRRGGLA
jgi:hypothetical protein